MGTLTAALTAYVSQPSLAFLLPSSCLTLKLPPLLLKLRRRLLLRLTPPLSLKLKLKPRKLHLPPLPQRRKSLPPPPYLRRHDHRCHRGPQGTHWIVTTSHRQIHHRQVQGWRREESRKSRQARPQKSCRWRCPEAGQRYRRLRVFQARQGREPQGCEEGCSRP